MAVNGRITVTNIEKDDKYDINGEVRTVENAVAKFAPRGFDGTVKLNGREVTDMGTALRDGDVVLLLNRTVAGGGIKGAC